MPATTSSPCALTRYSPLKMSSPVAASRVKATPVAEVSPMLPKTIICTFAIPAFMRLIHYVYGYDALLEPGITDRTMLNEQLLSAIFGGIVMVLVSV